MRLATVRIENYRCLQDVSVDLNDVTVLVGANGSGKSTLLRGLNWFFNGGALQLEDIFRHEPSSVVRVSATFTEFTDADRQALGRYVLGDTAIFSRTWSELYGEKLTGRAFTFRPFDEIRAIEGAVARRTAYNAFVEANPALGLGKASNRQELDDFMAVFEQANPEQLEPTEADATHLFGFVGGAKLNGRFAFVFVPAVSDAHEQLTGARGSLLSRLVERLPTVEGDVGAQLEALKEESQRRADELMRLQHAEGLALLGERMTAAVQEFVPAAEVQVDVQPPSVRVTDPVFDVRVADDGLPTDVAHQGHGFQRALILAALNELARAEQEGDVPAVLLAIEEPELYQHPLQARHFATVLSELPRRGEGSFQVAYATHSQASTRAVTSVSDASGAARSMAIGSSQRHRPRASRSESMGSCLPRGSLNASR
jgi:putative ATP-dependent endonuclease of the OLD family